MMGAVPVLGCGGLASLVVLPGGAGVGDDGEDVQREGEVLADQEVGDLPYLGAGRALAPAEHAVWVRPLAGGDESRALGEPSFCFSVVGVEFRAAVGPLLYLVCAPGRGVTVALGVGHGQGLQWWEYVGCVEPGPGGACGPALFGPCGRSGLASCNAGERRRARPAVSSAAGTGPGGTARVASLSRPG